MVSDPKAAWEYALGLVAMMDLISRNSSTPWWPSHNAIIRHDLPRGVPSWKIFLKNPNTLSFLMERRRYVRALRKLELPAGHIADHLHERPAFMLPWFAEWSHFTMGHCAIAMQGKDGAELLDRYLKSYGSNDELLKFSSKKDPRFFHQCLYYHAPNENLRLKIFSWDHHTQSPILPLIMAHHGMDPWCSTISPDGDHRHPFQKPSTHGNDSVSSWVFSTISSLRNTKEIAACYPQHRLASWLRDVKLWKICSIDHEYQGFLPPLSVEFTHGIEDYCRILMDEPCQHTKTNSFWKMLSSAIIIDHWKSGFAKALMREFRSAVPGVDDIIMPKAATFAVETGDDRFLQACCS